MKDIEAFFIDNTFIINGNSMVVETSLSLRPGASVVVCIVNESCMSAHDWS